MKKIAMLLLAAVLLTVLLPAAMAEEKPTLRVLGPYVGFDPNNDPTVQAIEEKTGYHV